MRLLYHKAKLGYLKLQILIIKYTETRVGVVATPT